MHKQTANRQGETQALPIDVEDILLHHVDGLYEAANALEHAQAESKESGHEIQALIQRLRNAGSDLRDHGKKVRIKMTKEQNPTAARLEYLRQMKQVAIEKNGERKALGKKGRDGYLDEYVIRDVHNRDPIWYAHFHYSGQQDSVESFSAAHLKTAKQHRQGLTTQIQQEQRGEEIVHIWRSRIDPDSAKRLFEACGTGAGNERDADARFKQ